MKKPVNLITLGLLIVSCFISSGCTQRKAPKDFKVGEHKCNHCQMGISDMRFRGEIMTPKGKLHYFDSIECLEAWSQKKPKGVHQSWVGSFFHKGEWIDYSKAYFLNSPKLNSPMGAGLSAYKSKEDVNRAKEIYGGRILTKKELHEYIVNWRKKL